MAEAGAAAAVNTLHYLIPLGGSIVTRLRGVGAQITSMEDELETIRVWINQAERSDNNDMVKDWVEKARKVCFRIEDGIDEYLFIEEKHHPRRRLVRVVYEKAHSVKTVKPRYDIASEIADIKNSITELCGKRAILGLNINPSTPESSSLGAEISTRHGLRSCALFMDDAELVGVDKTKKMLTDWLLKGEKKPTVIAVVGEAGLGKTTIANNVYKNQKEAFESFAWITVSRPLRMEKILKTMMESFYGNEYDNNKDAMKSTVALTEKLKEYLEERKYLVVFDNVWEEDFWKDVKNALPNNNKSSRIMITTRNMGVAEYCRRSRQQVHIYELEPLPPEDALSLLRHTAFNSDDDEGFPEELLELSEKLVKKCDGVPLAIVAIGGLLSTKRKTVLEWQKVHDTLHSKWASNQRYFESLDLILSESYNDLPCHLKFCLLSFGLFPEDHSINCVRLINLWIAEGFVTEEENENQTLVQIADEYLDKLIRRSLVKVSEVYPYNRVRRCRVHDLMHSFILKKCKELNFCQMKQSENFRFRAWTRRLSIQPSNIIDDNLQSTANYGKVRSCLVFKKLLEPEMTSLFSSFKLLKALDFEDAGLDSLPKAVKNLLLLKYLNLRNTRIKTIPKFIGKLLNLETLDLKHTLVCELPVEIYRLVKLRHLIANSFQRKDDSSVANIQGVKLEKGVGCLKALQRLSKVDTTDGDEVIKELGNLKRMRSLDITKLRRHNGKLLCSAIECMMHLHSLSIEAAEENEVLDLHLITNSPQYLQRLHLKGRLARLPKWISKLKSLVKLCLTWSGLKEDPLFILKDLSELEFLDLYKSYEGDELHCENNWFKNLKVLKLQGMHRLRNLKLDNGALPCLEELQLVSCSEMFEVPSDIQNLRKLKLLRLEDMPAQFGMHMQENGLDILRHIPSVIYFMDGYNIPISGTSIPSVI